MGLMTLIKAQGDRIVVKQDDAQETTKSGIILTSQAQQKPYSGVVESVGDKVTEDISIGDHIIYSRYAAVPVNVDGEEYLVIRTADVLCQL